jgi:tRNA G18 (ribose-2'-O)-methylase SpoU
VPFPLGLVIGNEVDGVSPHVVDLADGALELPMFGVKESLNVAVACGVALYELARRNRGR